MQQLGGSFDVVTLVRCLVTEVDSMQKIIAQVEARLQVLEQARSAPAELPARSARPAK